MYSLTEEEFVLLETCSTFEELADIALSSLERMSRTYSAIVQICGPMSTGGCGDFESNMKRFSQAVEIALQNGVAVFNQGVFQEAMIRICKWQEGTPYPMEILTVFYARVLASGHISEGWFLPDWESSVGARWEREFLHEQGIPVREYPPQWLD